MPPLGLGLSLGLGLGLGFRLGLRLARICSFLFQNNCTTLSFVGCSKFKRQDIYIVGMAISFESDEEFDTQFKWIVLWKNILDPIKYSGNQVRRFFGFEDGNRDGSKYILSAPTRIPN